VRCRGGFGRNSEVSRDLRALWSLGERFGDRGSSEVFKVEEGELKLEGKGFRMGGFRGTLGGI